MTPVTVLAQIDAANVTFDRQGIADHATDLASKIQGNLANEQLSSQHLAP